MVIACLPAVMLAACSGELSALDPAGPSAASIALLWWIMLGGGTAIFLATSAALALAWARPAVFGAQPSRLLIRWGGIVFPSAILIALVLAAFVLGERLLGRHVAEPFTIEVEVRQWQWEFRYPDTGVTTINLLHIPVDRDITFAVTSADVIHSFWIPRLGGKIDAIPGHRNTIRLRADTPGRYGGVCAEFCGEGHGAMRFWVEAHRPEDYERVLAGALEGAAP